MYLKIKKTFLLLLFFTLVQATAYGQATSTLIELDEVTVFSSRLEIQANQTGKQTQIIDGKSIQDYPVTSLDELLRYLPGIETQSRGGFGVQSDISLRGSTFNQVLVLIDGARVNDPLTGHFNSNIPITPAEIAQIEIVKGPAAVNFGPDAVGGVIHIITKTFNPQTTTKDQLVAQTKVQYGENQLTTTDAGLFYKKNGFRVSGGTLLAKSDGHSLQSDTLNGDFDLKTISASASYQGKKFHIAARTAYDYRLFNAQFFYTQSTFDLSRERVSRWWNQARFSYYVSDNYKAEFDFAYQSTKDSFLFNPLFSANNHQTHYTNLQTNHYLKLGSKTKLTLGAQADNRKVESNDRGNHQNWHYGIYARGFWEPINNLYVTPSFRLDYDEGYEWEWLPQLNVAYQLPKFTFRSVLGKSTRAADFTERFISNNLVGPLSPGRNLGNPSLKAETAFNAEVGIDYQATPAIKVSTTIFNRKASNLIDYLLTNEVDISNNGNLTAGADYFYARNLSAVNTFGTELTLFVEKNIKESFILNAQIGYLFLKTSNEADEVSKYIANHSHHLVTGSVSVQHKRFQCSLTTLFKNRDDDQAESINATLTPDYMVWNGQLQIAIVPEVLSLTAQINNIFDEDYADILGSRMPGRWFMGGIQWRLNKNY